MTILLERRGEKIEYDHVNDVAITRIVSILYVV